MGCTGSKLSTTEPVIANPVIVNPVIANPIVNNNSTTLIEKVFSFKPDETKPNMLDDIDIINKKISEEIKKKDSIIDLNTKISILQDEIQNPINDVFELIPNNIGIYNNSIIMCFLVKKIENNIIEFSIKKNNELDYKLIIRDFLVILYLNIFLIKMII